MKISQKYMHTHTLLYYIRTCVCVYMWDQRRLIKYWNREIGQLCKCLTKRRVTGAPRRRRTQLRTAQRSIAIGCAAICSCFCCWLSHTLSHCIGALLLLVICRIIFAADVFTLRWNSQPPALTAALLSFISAHACLFSTQACTCVYVCVVHIFRRNHFNVQLNSLMTSQQRHNSTRRSSSHYMYKHTYALWVLRAQWWIQMSRRAKIEKIKCVNNWQRRRSDSVLAFLWLDLFPVGKHFM